MAFEVTINDFSGPLDLMLHLIKEKEMDLFDLDIHLLTDQYIQYLKAMEAMHLEIASEYLTELATLIEYKSKRILPKDTSELDVDYEADSKDMLVKRLLEYQRFKEVIEPLNELFLQRSKQFDKPMQFELHPETMDVPLTGSPYDLVKAMQRCLRRAVLANPIKTKLTAKEVSVDDMVVRIKQKYAHTKTMFSFDQVVSDCQTLQEAIVSFLAVLDLIRLNLLNFELDDDKIWLRWDGYDNE